MKKINLRLLQKVVFLTIFLISALFAETKTIAFFTPWSNTNAVLFMNGDSVTIMTPLKNYCGWYRAEVEVPASGFNVHFKQTVGLNYVGAEGMTTIPPTIASEISLDSVALLSDTIWVQGYKNDIPALFSIYPGVLGDCPLKKFPVTLFDWLHGDNGDGDEEGKNGDPINGVSADFGSGGCRGASHSTGIMVGMVEKELGENGLPVPANPFPEDCKISTHLSSWFLPEVIAQDAEGNNYTNMTCRDLYISMDDEGFWLAEVSKDQISEGNEKHKDGMFPLDDFQYLDEAMTVLNPYYDQFKSTDGSGDKHNFGFTMKIQATFEYVPGQYFDFYGDDDVWVFINRKLVVDIGGQHPQKAGAVNLDSLGLVPGDKYDFHIFYAERHTGSSNFRMRTSIDLQVDASLFLTNKRNSNSVDYKIWQVNKKGTFSCGNDINTTELDTTSGAAIFKLTGGNLVGPEILAQGTHYEGIHITSDSTFSIDSAAIIASYALAPGHYFLEVTLKSDPSQMTKIEITIPSYAIPSVAFAKMDWTILGKDVSGDTVQIGNWTNVFYQVNITFLEEWAKVNNYNRKINLSFSDPNIDIFDTIDGQKISSVSLDDNGRATFYVYANAPVAGASLIAKGAAAGVSVWRDLDFVESPIPKVLKAVIKDRNGDGRADSLFVRFDRSLLEKSSLDSIQITFGESFKVTSQFSLVNEMDVVAVAEKVSPENCTGDVCGFGSRLFTGSNSDVYFGSLNNWFSYKDSSKVTNFYQENNPIEDGVGPIILSAASSRINDANKSISLTFSEAISEESRNNNYMEMFEFICMRSGVNEIPEYPAMQSSSHNTMVFVYSSTDLDVVVPTAGDQIRFNPDNETKDLVGNVPHKNNPWVPITGEQEFSNESPKVITIGEDPYNIIKTDIITQPMIITNLTQNAQEIGDSLGVQGNLIDYDFSKIVIEKTKKEAQTLESFIESRLENITSYDTLITSISEQEALSQVFADIRTGELNSMYGFSEETIAAVIAGTITEENFNSSISENELLVITKLMQDNIDATRDTVISLSAASQVTQSDLFNAMRNGSLDKELKKAGVSQTLIDAIKNDEVTEFNLEEFSRGSKLVYAEDDVQFFYRTHYYSHLGEYVGGTSNSIKCSDNNVFGEEGCIQNKGKMFLAWNMRSTQGRLVATGVYISLLEIKIIVNGKTSLHQISKKRWGVKRSLINELQLEF